VALGAIPPLTEPSGTLNLTTTPAEPETRRVAKPSVGASTLAR
jgi:hypothetical protein